MTDITKLAHGNSLRKKLNRRLNDAYGFQRTSGGKHTTISLSINECKSIIAAMDERLALVEALDKAKQRIVELDRKNCELDSLTQRWAVERAENADRIADLESRTVKLPEPEQWDITQVLLCKKKVVAAIRAAGIKVEAE